VNLSKMKKEEESYLSKIKMMKKKSRKKRGKKKEKKKEKKDKQKTNLVNNQTKCTQRRARR